MKLLTDFFPILLFFLAYKFAGIYMATGVAMLAALLQTCYTRYKTKRFEPMNLFTLAVITILGGATLVFHNEMFIKWKPTVLNWLFAVLFLGSQFFSKQTILQRLLAEQVEVNQAIWQRLNFAWAIFFVALGLINLYVAYHFDTNIWVNFKLFGILGFTMLFAVGQAVCLAKYVKHEKTT